MFYANVPSTIFIIIINVNERIFEAEICMQNHFSDFSKRTWNKQQFILHLHSHCTRNCWFANAVKHWRIPIDQSSPYQANELINNSLCDTPSAASNKMGKQAFCIFHWYKWVYRFFLCCPVRCVLRWMRADQTGSIWICKRCAHLVRLLEWPAAWLAGCSQPVRLEFVIDYVYSQNAKNSFHCYFSDVVSMSQSILFHAACFLIRELCATVQHICIFLFFLAIDRFTDIMSTVELCAILTFICSLSVACTRHAAQYSMFSKWHTRGFPRFSNADVLLLLFTFSVVIIIEFLDSKSRFVRSSVRVRRQRRINIYNNWIPFGVLSMLIIYYIILLSVHTICVAMIHRSATEAVYLFEIHAPQIIYTIS